MKKFQFIFVSKDNIFLLSRDETTKFESMHPEVTFAYVANNTASLADVYNEFILEHRKKKDVDYLVLMHADVRLNLEKLIQHVSNVEGKYDVIGLCGCSKISLAEKPLNWYTGSKKYPTYRWGCVTHGELKNQTSYFSAHSPDKMDAEVACIDGLCIIFTPKALYESDIMFDNTFKFNQYDTDISLQCVLQKKLKLGCIVEKDLMHFSVGKSILTDDFLKSEEKLREKWKQYLS